MIFGVFLSGVTTATFFASSVFFVKFWRASRDKFFLLFAMACALLGLERLTLAIFFPSHNSDLVDPGEAQFWIYLIRAAAFSLILLAFIQRNRK